MKTETAKSNIIKFRVGKLYKMRQAKKYQRGFSLAEGNTVVLVDHNSVVRADELLDRFAVWYGVDPARDLIPVTRPAA